MRVAFLLLLICSGSAAGAPENAVVRITSHGCSGSVVWTGPGRSYVLSCAHAFEGRARDRPIVIDVQHPAAGATRSGGIRLLRLDAVRDLSLIEVLAGPMPHVVRVAPAGTRPGRCVSVGYDEMVAGARGEPTVRAATVTGSTSRREAAPVLALYTREQPWHGRSGGALLCDGRLVGVVSGYTSDERGRFVVGRHVGVYASLPAVRAFLWPPPARPAAPT